MEGTLDELERRLDRLEFMVGVDNQEPTSLSSQVDALVRDVDIFAHKHPEIETTLRLLTQRDLKGILSKNFQPEAIQEITEARVDSLSLAVKYLEQLKDLAIPELGESDLVDNVNEIKRACWPTTQSFDEATVRSASLLMKYLETVQNANYVAGEVEIACKAKRLE